ncbi:MAG: carbamoyltransferase HypF [Actinobacteria bacterium]|nr:carbamoyltransferase HypF [Actinomycetota bacterium]
MHATGVVQGVGFRPFVYTLATRLGVTGWVKNTSEGVFILAEGESRVIDMFISALEDESPPMSAISMIVAEEVDPEGHREFVIVSSEVVEGAMTLVSPDIATCEACAAELRDPADRRLGYPFTNCTNCGPRFTIIADVPYDRPLTTMRDFPLCDECAAEYADPADRRFHAQPNACFRCGPRLYLNADGAPDEWRWTAEREVVPRAHRDPDCERDRAGAIIDGAVRLLRDGAILAVKGLGGFQLACDAANDEAVLRLRERKMRWGKPLAVMMPSLEAVREHCAVSTEEEALLTGPSAPIVLLMLSGERRLAPSLAPGLRELGAMLPYTPLHHLLLEAFGGPLVMTSGNRSEEPIATGNAEALRRLSSIADAFLMHDRGIYSRYDDSVMRHTPQVGAEFFRRARGYAPFPLPAPEPSDVDILACGPEQKNTFCLLSGTNAFVSQHMGDMENAETLESYEQTIELYERLFRVRPEIVAYDLHPEYLSTKHALSLGLPTIGVQHHHAHVVSVTGEHGVRERVLGVALDGTGYGTDGTIWGGEWLAADWADFERAGHLRTVPLPGGAAAIRRPARMALGVLVEFGLLEHPGAAALLGRMPHDERTTVLGMISHGLNTPRTSSMGRLFDAVAALAGVRDDALYEGQAAIELEALAHYLARGAYAFGIIEDGPGTVVVDSEPVIRSVLDDLASGTPAAVVSIRFHRAVVAAIADACARIAPALGITHVALSGGVFMNRLVLSGAVEGLRHAGLTPLTHTRLPANDGGVSYGQAIVAWARRHEV